MTTPNTWGDEYYHRLSQAMPPTPRPLPDDPGTPEARTYSRKQTSRIFWCGYWIGSAVTLFSAYLGSVLGGHTP